MADQGADWRSPEDDAGGWAAPGAQPDPSPSPPPRYGERVPVAPAGDPGPAFRAVPIGAATYVPPPKPGLFPLHPLDFGRLLGTAFQVLRWSPAATIVPSLVLQALTTGILYGGGAAIGLTAIDRITNASDADRGAIIAGTVAQGVVAALALFAVSLFGAALLQGVVVLVVARGGVGERSRLGATVRRAARSVVPLALYALLLGLAQFVAGALVIGVAVLIAQAGTVGVVLAVVVGIVGGLGLVVLYVWIAVQLALVPSVIVLERRRIRPAIARSWRLVRGSFWRTFGVVALVLLIVGAAAQIISVPFSILGGVITGLLAPNAGDDVGTQLGLSLIATVPSVLVGVLIQGIGQVAQVAAVALVYLDLRMRREGLDIELRERVESGRGAEDAFAAPPGT